MKRELTQNDYTSTKQARYHRRIQATPYNPKASPQSNTAPTAAVLCEEKKNGAPFIVYLPKHSGEGNEGTASRLFVARVKSGEFLVGHLLLRDSDVISGSKTPEKQKPRGKRFRNKKVYHTREEDNSVQQIPEACSDKD